jgi:hypothetical protein
MKRRLDWVVPALVLAFCFVWLGGMARRVEAADNGPRFEKISDEHFDPRYNHAVIFETWHDKLGGEEFTCVGSRDTNNTGGIDGKAWPLSCFPTGRKW